MFSQEVISEFLLKRVSLLKGESTREQNCTDKLAWLMLQDLSGDIAIHRLLEPIPRFNSLGFSFNAHLLNSGNLFRGLHKCNLVCRECSVRNYKQKVDSLPYQKCKWDRHFLKSEDNPQANPSPEKTTFYSITVVIKCVPN